MTLKASQNPTPPRLPGTSDRGGAALEEGRDSLTGAARGLHEYSSDDHDGGFQIN